MTQLSLAKDGVTTEEMKVVAAEEGFSFEEIRELVAKGQVVIPKNINHDFSPKVMARG